MPADAHGYSEIHSDAIVFDAVFISPSMQLPLLYACCSCPCCNSSSCSDCSFSISCRRCFLPYRRVVGTEMRCVGDKSQLNSSREGGKPKRQNDVNGVTSPIFRSAELQLLMLATIPSPLMQPPWLASWRPLRCCIRVISELNQAIY